ncbi:cytochrome c biogenesis heme-transporting ATPase CcmA [Allopusillimonas ginsengisoli]|uniref:cytochrome c biogenesis heme-transporting ATPase CcmA n=1 Tax=Allopusillimonas ginsengisoli TaxID=453575 RepID=UPI0010217D3F|nr:cytochrome c biogenesis heme-transporting ATPase CcmA [Allopusillimonas ginsengisoli]TEA78982.1 cytochrome c biogenesis heme-transporting ATPase CcmA [Allopusillimonas ginsengisoli]
MRLANNDYTLPATSRLTTLFAPGTIRKPAEDFDIFELSEVRCMRGTKCLFDGLNVQLQPGGLLRIRGANGTGKTSLLRMLCGLSRADAGQIRWSGQDIHRLGEEFSRQIIYIGHAPASKAELSAHENLMIALTLQGASATANAAEEALASAGLLAYRDAPVRFLSQGQRRRLALARLACRPAPTLWILDEPFTALDAAARVWLKEMVECHLSEGGIVILTSHDETGLEQRPHQVIAL